MLKLKLGDKEIATESVITENDNYIFTEATKLSKKEEAITDPKEIEVFIKKYEDAISGKTILKNKKTGNPLSKKYCQDRLRLFKKKLAFLQSGNNAETTSAKEENKKDTSNQNTDQTKLTEKTKDKKPIGDIHINVDGIKNYIGTIKNTSIADESINQAAQTGAVVIGGNKVKEVIDGNSEKPKEKEGEKKKGLLSKISDKVNVVGNKLKEKIKSGVSKAKEWFNSQNKIVKILICCIIAVLAILAIYFLITAVIYPILYGILNGGIVNAIARSI